MGEGANHETIITILAIATFVMALLGWAYMMGFTNAKTNRNERDIERIRTDTDKRFEIIGNKISKGLDRIYDKIDQLPCKSGEGRRMPAGVNPCDFEGG